MTTIQPSIVARLNPRRVAPVFVKWDLPNGETASMSYEPLEYKDQTLDLILPEEQADVGQTADIGVITAEIISTHRETDRSNKSIHWIRVQFHQKIEV